MVRRGYEELFEIKPEQESRPARKVVKKAAGLPIMLKQLPEGDGGISDVHRFWEQTGSFYMKGQGSDNLVDPFIGLSVIPAVTGVYRDMTGVRFEHPEWNAENCTACGECYTVCPDSAIPGLVFDRADVLNTAIQRIETGGTPTRFLRSSARTIDKKLRAPDRRGRHRCARRCWPMPSPTWLPRRPSEDRVSLEAELKLLTGEIGDFKFATTKPYWTQKEKKEKGAGGLFSITINPYTCKGCALCVEVCDDNALTMVTQTAKPSRRCATTGTSGSTCPPRRRNSAASTTWMKRSARWKRCCWTSTTTSPWSAATAPVWAAAKSPPSTCSPAPSPR